MRGLTIAWIAMALLAVSAGASARASMITDIDFDGSPMGVLRPGDFPDLIFTGASVLPPDSNPNFQEHNGNKLIYNYSSNSIMIQFLDPGITGVGAYATAGAALTETAYNDGSVVGTDGFSAANYDGANHGLSPNRFVEVTGSDITSVTFTAGTSLDTFTLADLTVTVGGFSGAPTVPEPASFALLAAGVIGVAATRFRR